MACFAHTETAQEVLYITMNHGIQNEVECDYMSGSDRTCVFAVQHTEDRKKNCDNTAIAFGIVVVKQRTPDSDETSFSHSDPFVWRQLRIVRLVIRQQLVRFRLANGPGKCVA